MSTPTKPRYVRSPRQEVYSNRDSEAWGAFVRFIELGEDGYALRQVDEYSNGFLTRYDRAHWEDQYGTLASVKFGEIWIRHWGEPEVIAADEFEARWAQASLSPPT